jgi:hypothetical protein
MIRESKTRESIKAIAGVAFIGLGLHILSRNLAATATQLAHLLGDTTGNALGVLPSVVLASSQAAQAYALDRQVFLQCFLRMLISFWPLLLVIVGTILLPDVFANKVKALPTTNQYFKNNNFKNKPSGCRFRCPSFDV